MDNCVGNLTQLIGTNVPESELVMSNTVDKPKVKIEKIDSESTVLDAMDVLKQFELDSLSVSLDSTHEFQNCIKLTVDELRIADEDKCIGDLIEEKFHDGDTQDRDEIDYSCEIGDCDFSEINNAIKLTKIKTGQDLLEYATNNLPDEIPILLDITNVQLQTKIGDLDTILGLSCSGDLYENQVTTVRKLDVLKTISSDLDRWTDIIKDKDRVPSYNLQKIIEYAIEVSSEETSDVHTSENDLELSVDNWSCDLKPDFNVNTSKYALDN